MAIVVLFFSFRVNCSFYFKIGACRHGDKCSRLHNKPTFSQVNLWMLYTVMGVYTASRPNAILRI